MEQGATKRAAFVSGAPIHRRCKNKGPSSRATSRESGLSSNSPPGPRGVGANRRSRLALGAKEGCPWPCCTAQGGALPLTESCAYNGCRLARCSKRTTSRSPCAHRLSRRRTTKRALRTPKLLPRSRSYIPCRREAVAVSVRNKCLVDPIADAEQNDEGEQILHCCYQYRARRERCSLGVGERARLRKRSLRDSRTFARRRANESTVPSRRNRLIRCDGLWLPGKNVDTNRS